MFKFSFNPKMSGTAGRWRFQNLRLGVSECNEISNRDLFLKLVPFIIRMLWDQGKLDVYVVIGTYMQDTYRSISNILLSIRSIISIILLNKTSHACTDTTGLYCFIRVPVCMALQRLIKIRIMFITINLSTV